MRALLPILASAALLAACSRAPTQADSVAVIDRFHTALNADDTATIDALLTRSTRDLRPGIGTARAFRALSARHGRYRDGTLDTLRREGDRTTIVWRARYELGPVSELFVLVAEDGAARIDSYSDDARS
jgi:hypothetical protein